MTTSELTAERRTRAEQAFELYDHGDMVIDSAGGWESDTGADEWRRTIFVRSPTNVNSVEVAFAVRFVPGSPEVEEAYYSG